MFSFYAAIQSQTYPPLGIPLSQHTGGTAREDITVLTRPISGVERGEFMWALVGRYSGFGFSGFAKT